MAIKIYEKLEDVPEPLRKTAIETKDEHFAVDDGDDYKELRIAAEKERARASELEKEKRTLEVERNQLKAEREARARGATEEEIAKRRKEIDDATKPLKDEIAEKDRKLRQVLHIDRVRALALAAGIMPDRIGKAMKELKDRTDLTDDGKGLVVKDEAGNVLATRIEDFLERDFKAEAPYYYTGAGTSGSGARQSTGTAPTNADRVARTEEQLKAEKRSIVSQAF